MTTSPALPATSSLGSLKAEYLALLTALEAIADDHPGALPAPSDDLSGAIGGFEVTLPLVGSFSAGKSSLINAFLGQRVLKTRLTPTTAVPTEIRFGSPRAEVLDHHGGIRRLDLEAFKVAEFTSQETPLIRLYLDLPRLAAFPELVLVDVPGLESGLRTHDTAIRSYLPTSVAYLLVAEMECGLTGAVLDVLRELQLHQKPVAVALTKSDKKPAADVPGILAHNHKTVRDTLGHERFALFASSIRDQEQGGLHGVLEGLRLEAAGLFRSRFHPQLDRRVQLLKRYLSACLEHAEADTATLEERMRECRAELVELAREVAREFDRLDVALLRAESNVLNRVRAAVSEAATELAGLRDKDAFNQRLNALIRQTATMAMKAEIEPITQQSLEHIGTIVDEHTGEFDFSLPSTGGGSASTPEFVSNLYFHLPVALYPVIELIESFVSIIFGDGGRRGPSDDEIRNRMLDTIEHEILPQVTAGLHPQIHEAISSIGQDVRGRVERHLNEQAATLEHALAACLAQKSEREAEAGARRAALEATLEQVIAIERRLTV